MFGRPTRRAAARPLPSSPGRFPVHQPAAV